MEKLEIYGLSIAVFLLVCASAFYAGDLHGRYGEKSAALDKQQAADTKAINNYAGQLKDRADADTQAADRTKQLIAVVDEGIANAQKKFAGLPTVVMDAHGCPVLTAASRLRWNAVELLPTGPADLPTGDTAGPLPTGAVSAPR